MSLAVSTMWSACSTRSRPTVDPLSMSAQAINQVSAILSFTSYLGLHAREVCEIGAHLEVGDMVRKDASIVDEVIYPSREMFLHLAGRCLHGASTHATLW